MVVLIIEKYLCVVLVDKSYKSANEYYESQSVRQNAWGDIENPSMTYKKKLSLIIARGAQTASRKTANFIWRLQIQNLSWGQRGTWSWSQNVQNLTLNLKANSRFWFDPHWGWKWRIKLPILNLPPGGTKFSVLRVKFRESKSAIFFGSIWAILLV